MPPLILKRLRSRLGTDWKHEREIDRGSTAYGLMIRGAYALSGKAKMHMTLKLLIITDGRNAMRTDNLIHPGEILREEFMIPMGISQNKLAIELRIPASRIGEIVNERRGISTDTAVRLGIFFGTGPEFWTNLQTNYDLGVALKRNKEEFSMIRAYAPAI